MPTIGWYLDKIAQGKPVNPQSLARAWGKTGNALSTLQAVLRLNTPAGTPVEIADPQGFARLCEHYGAGKDLSNRLTAAKTGNSHAVPVSENFLLIRSETHPHPEVILVSECSHTSPRTLASRVLIVENLALFMAFEKTLAFCRRHTALPNDAIELVFGSGWGIHTERNHRWLATFEHTYWLPDLDHTGLAIVGAAITALGETRATLLVPNHLDDLLSTSGHTLDDSGRNQLVVLGKKYPAFQPVIANLLHAGKLLEQEAYLATV